MIFEVLVREIENGRPRPAQSVVQVERPNRLAALEQVGMNLDEGKELLARIQQLSTAWQADHESRARRSCSACGSKQRLKDYRTRKIDTVFGRVPLRIARTVRSCRCAPNKGEQLLGPGRSTPQFDCLRARFAAELSFRRARSLLQAMLPLSTGVAPTTIRAHMRRAGRRIAETRLRLASDCRNKVSALTLGLDTAYIRCRDEAAPRHLSILVGEVSSAHGPRRIFAGVAHDGNTHASLIREHLRLEGYDGTATKLAVMTDGQEALRLFARRSIDGPVTPVLDWFHIAMRVQHIRQAARGLTTRLPSHIAAKQVLCRELARMRTQLWRGVTDCVDQCIDRASGPIGAFRRYPPKRRTREALRSLWTALFELRRYVRSNAHLLIDYAARQRSGGVVSTARVESAVNHLVNRRMNKSQQMRWSVEGAHQLLQVRAALFNGDFDSLVRSTTQPLPRWAAPQTAIAA